MLILFRLCREQSIIESAESRTRRKILSAESECDQNDLTTCEEDVEINVFTYTSAIFPTFRECVARKYHRRRRYAERNNVAHGS